MAKGIGSVLALVALSAGILNQVDATTCLWRAAIAFMLGWIGTLGWQALFIATSRISISAPDAVPALPTPSEEEKG